MKKILKWINDDLSKDDKKAGKKQWFSVWVFIFWLIAFFPAAFLYIIVKAIQRGPSK
ncbi:hypothetical protein HN448_04395 [archaeon]|jgi:hypothetical protein|nr:hypothetical protein [archaeon]